MLLYAKSSLLLHPPPFDSVLRVEFARPRPTLLLEFNEPKQKRPLLLLHSYLHGAGACFFAIPKQLAND